jgi:hypothetical protein
MCPNCWNKLTLCDECSHRATLCPEPSPFTLTCGTSTGLANYTLPAEQGRYNVVLMPGTGMMLATGCTPLVSSSS